jgi:hypothetical protein
MQNAFDIMGICPAVLFSSNLLRLCLKQNARAPGLENKKHLKKKTVISKRRGARAIVGRANGRLLVGSINMLGVALKAALLDAAHLNGAARAGADAPKDFATQSVQLATALRNTARSIHERLLDRVHLDLAKQG